MYEYDLFAVIRHDGQIDNGHYTCYARYQDEVRVSPSYLAMYRDTYRIQWYHFDDDKYDHRTL